ncbi:CoA transferase [soil metagenome]
MTEHGDHSTQGPLSGIRILAVEQFGAGPFATLFLADLGAEVIKIEDPGTGGDVGRTIPPGVADGDSLYFQAFNRGKRSIALDLKATGDRAVFESLVRDAHAVFNNLRGDLPDKLGLTYEHLSAFNPAIVCVSLSAYGRRSERAAERGYDALVQAEAGWAALTGEPDGPPTRSGLPMADYTAGLTAALALVSGLLNAVRTGKGRNLDTSLYEVALSMLAYQATWLLSDGIETRRQPLSAHPTIVPFQFFETSDGFIAVACAKEKFFASLAALIELPELNNDVQFSTFANRLEHRDELIAVLSAQFRRQTSAFWLERLTGSEPCAPVRSMNEALALDELRERGLLAEFDHDSFGVVRSVGLPIRVDGYEPTYRRGPLLDEFRSSLPPEKEPG